MTKPTPGPWHYRPDGYDDWGIVRASNEVGRLIGPIICQARDPEATDECTLAKHRAAKTDPWEANARLIAAAPDGLALAEAFDAFAKSGVSFVYPPGSLQMIAEYLAKARGPQ